jgi:hypothetical protein
MSDWAIPAGQEALVGRMFATGETIAGCTLSGAAIQQVRIAATFKCGEQSAVVVADHVSKGEGVKTERFVLTPGDPPASAELLDAVATRFRTEESAFNWVEIKPAPKVVQPSPPQHEDIPFQQNPATWGFAVLIIGLAIFVALKLKKPAVKGP